MREVETTLAVDGEDWHPVRVHHQALSLNWTVTEVLESWKEPDWPAHGHGPPAARLAAQAAGLPPMAREAKGKRAVHPRRHDIRQPGPPVAPARAQVSRMPRQP